LIKLLNDGKEKKPSFSSPLACLFNLRRLWEIKAAAFLCPAQDRRPTEGAAMLIYPVFQKRNFLKKACAQQGAALPHGSAQTECVRLPYDAPLYTGIFFKELWRHRPFAGGERVSRRIQPGDYR
jgi:hypothetical protein